jgi:hypothetical protein
VEARLRKLKAHGFLQRDGARYASQLTSKGVQVALLILELEAALETSSDEPSFADASISRHLSPVG